MQNVPWSLGMVVPPAIGNDYNGSLDPSTYRFDKCKCLKGLPESNQR